MNGLQGQWVANQFRRWCDMEGEAVTISKIERGDYNTDTGVATANAVTFSVRGFDWERTNGQFPIATNQAGIGRQAAVSGSTRRFVIPGNVPFEPIKGMFIEQDGKRYSITDVVAGKVGATVVGWVLSLSNA